MIQASIIIPAYNDAEHLRQTLQAINQQDYSQEKTEVFVVDNGSTDNTSEVAKGFPFVQLLKEEQYLGSPYSARNRGIEAACGEVIILLDSTCVPDKDWFSNGITCLKRTNADIAAGNVRLEIDENSSVSELYDAVTNIQIEETVKHRKAAPTANLFVKGKVFQEIGQFPEGVRSGGDLRWTQKATQKGFNLIFCEGAKSYKPARKFRGLVKKQWRVAKSQPAIWKTNGKKVNLGYLILVLGVFLLLYPIINKLSQKLNNSDVRLSFIQKLRLHCLHYLISLIMKVGNIYGHITNRNK